MACQALVERYQRLVFALLSRMCGHGPHTEDLAQETFLRVFRALPSFDPNGKARLSTWILTIASRLAIDELRARPRATLPLEEVSEPVSEKGADEYSERRDIGEAISKAIRRLPPEQQATFLLREFHELDYEELSEALGVDIGTIKSRLSRARAALREALAALKP